MEGPSNQTNHSHISDYEYNVTYFQYYNVTTSADPYYPVHTNPQYESTDEYIVPVVDYLIVSFALLGLCFVIYGLYSLVKNNQSSPVFVINLFVSDLIQTTARLVQISTKLLESSFSFTRTDIRSYMRLIYYIAVMDNISFMVCISAERYVMIAYPVWYRTNQTTRASVFVSVIVWIISAFTVICAIVTQFYFAEHFELIVLMFLILPYPLVIFFLVGTWMALSKSTSVSYHDQIRIMGTLAFILCIYTVLFLPYIVVEIDFFFNVVEYAIWIDLLHASHILMSLNPLFDFLLYLFTRRDAKDLLCALFKCCQKRQVDNPTTETVTSHT